MRYIEIKAPAKINIGLDILSKREDGYHNLNTLFYPIVDLFDTLHVEQAEYFSFACSDYLIPIDETNLVVKAKNLLESYSGKIMKVKIDLIKRIPSQAGLGGGSSDAAATLISLNEMFQLEIKYETMINLALELGSDVPFFLKAKPAIGTSRGELLEPLNLEIDKAILVANPGINVSTKDAFASINPSAKKTNFRSILDEERLNYARAMQIIKNDFEEVVFYKYPEIGNIKKICLENGAIFSLMSGSGSTVYAIFNSEEEANKVRNILPAKCFTFISLPLD
jgi:4-diphosphocytidyl-2-C-methyl-D-erythritol kinase